MSERCPTCARPLEGPALTDRILAYLVAAEGRPVQSVELTKFLGSKSTLIYQATRRLKERGAIRKATISPVGSGWVLTPHAPVTTAAAQSADTLRLDEALQGLVAYIGSVDELAWPSAVRFLARQLPADYADSAEDMLRDLVTGNTLREVDGRLRVS